MYTIYEFCGVALPQQRPSQYHGVGQLDNSNQYPLPDGGMYDGFGTEQQHLQGASISVNGAISTRDQSASDLESQERTLRALLGQRGNLWRRWDVSGSVEWCDARLMNIDSTRIIDNIAYVDLVFTFQQFSRSWYTDYINSVILYDLGSSEDDLTTCGAESDPTPITFTGSSDYGGDDQPNIIFTITAGTADITDLIITNPVTGHSMEYDGVILAGNTLVIDCGALTVENNGVGDYVHLHNLVAKNEWFLVPKQAYLTITITITNDPDPYSGAGPMFEYQYYDAKV